MQTTEALSPDDAIKFSRIMESLAPTYDSIKVLAIITTSHSTLINIFKKAAKDWVLIRARSGNAIGQIVKCAAESALNFTHRLTIFYFVHDLLHHWYENLETKRKII